MPAKREKRENVLAPLSRIPGDVSIVDVLERTPNSALSHLRQVIGKD